MDISHGHQVDPRVDNLISLIDKALILSDELGFAFVGIDLDNAAAKLELMRSVKLTE